RHTRFSRDWSSDVCSSDLTSMRMVTCVEIAAQVTILIEVADQVLGQHAGAFIDAAQAQLRTQRILERRSTGQRDLALLVVRAARSEERRGGKGWSGGCSAA